MYHPDVVGCLASSAVSRLRLFVSTLLMRRCRIFPCRLPIQQVDATVTEPLRVYPYRPVRLVKGDYAHLRTLRYDTVR